MTEEAKAVGINKELYTKIKTGLLEVFEINAKKSKHNINGGPEGMAAAQAVRALIEFEEYRITRTDIR